MGDVTLDARGRVLEITLARGKVNAIDAATSRALGAAFQRLQDDDGLSVAILSGGGTRFFSRRLGSGKRPRRGRRRTRIWGRGALPGSPSSGG